MEWYKIILGVLVIVSIITVIVAMFSKNKKFKKIVYDLVLEAEESIIGDKMGEARYQYVVEKIATVIPDNLRPYLTHDKISAIIEWAVDKMKSKLKE